MAEGDTTLARLARSDRPLVELAVVHADTEVATRLLEDIVGKAGPRHNRRVVGARAVKQDVAGHRPGGVEEGVGGERHIVAPLVAAHRAEPFEHRHLRRVGQRPLLAASARRAPVDRRIECADQPRPAAEAIECADALTHRPAAVRQVAPDALDADT